VLGLSFVIDTGKALKWWNFRKKVGMVAHWWKLYFDIGTIVKFGFRSSSQSRTGESRKKLPLLQSEKKEFNCFSFLVLSLLERASVVLEDPQPSSFCAVKSSLEK
jgi:hypothetical protein